MPTQPSWYNASLLAVEEEETEGLQVFLMIMAMIMMIIMAMIILAMIILAMVQEEEK